MKTDVKTKNIKAEIILKELQVTMDGYDYITNIDGDVNLRIQTHEEITITIKMSIEQAQMVADDLQLMLSHIK